MLHRGNGDLYQSTTSPLPAGGEKTGDLPPQCDPTHHAGDLIDEDYEESPPGLFKAEQTDEGCFY